MNTFLRATIIAAFSFHPAIAREPNSNELRQLNSSSNLVFIENKGQVTDQHHQPRTDIDFKLNAPGMSIFIGDGEIHYQWARSQTSPTKITERKLDEERLMDGQDRTYVSDHQDTVTTYRLDVELIGANKKAKVVAEEQQAFYERYYTMETGEEGLVTHSFRRITYRNIYPNIDWVLYLKDNQLKYDFVVRAGGNVADIKLKYKGATSLNLKNGALTATSPFGSVTEAPPYSYEAETKRAITSQYHLQGEVLSFTAGSYNGILVIDPVLDWATYYGGPIGTLGSDRIESMATDAMQNIYCYGTTENTSNIVTAGAFQTTIINGRGGYLVKFSTAGVRQWATYYNGIHLAYSHSSITCDAMNNIYIGGAVSAANAVNMTTAGCYQSTFGGGLRDAFVAKFNGTGQRLWSTYYGGSDADATHSIAVDGAGNVVMSGQTTSTTNISTPGSHAPTHPFGSSVGGTCAFVVKFTSGGQRLWGTYYPAWTFNVVTTDISGNIIAAGYGGGDPGIATPGSHQPIEGGLGDCFLVKFTPNGQRLWGTYYGGTASEYCGGLVTDMNENIYFAGETSSPNNIGTPGTYMPVHTPTTTGSYMDGFLVKFSPSGQRMWGTYYGYYNGFDNLYNICFDGIRHIYITGSTTSAANIATPGSHKLTLSGWRDAFLAKFDLGGQQLWGSYFGGNDWDLGYGLSSDAAGHVILGGWTTSVTGVSTPGSHQPTHGGGDEEAFVAKFINDDTLVYIQMNNSDSVLCIGDSLHVGVGTTRAFDPGNIFTLQLSDANGSFASAATLATLPSVTGGTISVLVPASIATGTDYRIRIIASAPADTSVYKIVRVRTRPPKPNATSNTPVCSNRDLYLTGSSSTAGVSYNWTGPGFSSNQQNPSVSNMVASPLNPYQYLLTTFLNGCFSEPDTEYVYVELSPPNPIIISDSIICVGDSLWLASVYLPGIGVDHHWRGPNAFSYDGFSYYNTIHNFSLNDTGIYKVWYTLPGNGCWSDTGYMRVTAAASVVPSVSITASPGINISPWTTVTFTATPTNGGTTPAYQWLRNGQPIIGATGSTWSSFNLANNDAISVIMTSNENCASPAKDTSNVLVAQVNMGIGDQTSASNIVLHPNPNKGEFTIKATAQAEGVLVEVFNTLGQVIYSETIPTKNNMLDHPVQLDAASGMYLLKINTGKQVETIRFELKRE